MALTPSVKMAAALLLLYFFLSLSETNASLVCGMRQALVPLMVPENDLKKKNNNNKNDNCIL